MRKDKTTALAMRSQGKSYRDIMAALNIPRSTLSGWLSGHEWSERIKEKLNEKAREQHTIRLCQLNDVRGERLEQMYRDAALEAEEEFRQFKYHPLFLCGIGLYWGEGGKGRMAVKLGNTDPEMIKVFIQFLREVCGVPVDKIRGHAVIYPDLDPKECITYWHEATGLPLENFSKPTTIKGRHKLRRLPHGVLTVSYHSSFLRKKIERWTELLGEEMLTQKYYADIV